MKKLNLAGFSLAAALTLFAAGCASSPPLPDAMAFTRGALAATDPAKVPTVEKGSAAEKAAIERFKTFNSDFSKENILKNTRLAYADDLYFRDPFKVIHGETEFEAYLLRGSDAVADFSMEWKDVSSNNGEYYFRWIMSVKLKRDGKNDPPSLTTGISHVRFGKDGRVIFHQDYFDGASLLYERVPIMGWAIRAIKKRV